jgi:hypothetical protein
MDATNDPSMRVNHLAGANREAGGMVHHALTEITISDPVTPVMMIGIPLSRCAQGDSRRQP